MVAHNDPSRGSDVMDQLARLDTNHELAKVRRNRPDVVRFTQAADDALFSPADDGGLSPLERAAVALYVARFIGDADLATHYEIRLRDATGDRPAIEDRRWSQIREHAALLTRAPDTAQPDHIQSLHDVGLSSQAIVALSQLIAYVNYQARVLAGLRALKGPPQ
jgi:uncharacterized protein YciW